MLCYTNRNRIKYVSNSKCVLLDKRKHFVKGSPVYPCLHVQIGLWFKAIQFVFIPQSFRHGSIHFWFTQALLNGHSEFRTHSGRHPGGLPTYPSKQEQTAWSFITRHWLLGPHGDGLQGSFLTESIDTRKYKILLF